MEHNKGKLIPVNVDTEHFTEEDYETYTENGFAVINGIIYEVEWDVQQAFVQGFAHVAEKSDGSIDFNIFHYNGNTLWVEVVENTLNRGV